METKNRLWNKTEKDVLSISDIQEIARLGGHKVEYKNDIWKGQKVFRTDVDVGLFTFEELKIRFLH